MGGKLHLEVGDNVTPVVMPPRRVLVAVKVKLKEEFDRLENLELIRREDEPTMIVQHGCDSEVKWQS